MSHRPFRCIIGLGNPGSQYAQTRHNIGFNMVDALLWRAQGVFRLEPRFKAEVAKTAINIKGVEQAVFWLKPQTFMNLSGEAVGPFLRFYHIDATDILVIYDELDVLVGEAKLKKGGGIAGHNGMRSLVQHLGTQDFWRLRLGIGRPPPRYDVADYVLGKPTLTDRALLDNMMDKVMEVWPLIISGDMTKAMTALHTQEKPTTSVPPKPMAQS